MEIPYPANIYVREALQSAVKKLEATIENCGALTHKDAKQSDSAKAYFVKMEEESKATIETLKEIIRGIV